MSARILVADDNVANLELMLYLLRAFGYAPEGVADGVAAFQAISRGNFDMVVSDILMPGIDGYELARLMKSDPRLKGTPLVAVTALAMSGDRERVAAAGFDGYITKPIEPQTFVSQLRAFLPAAAS